MVSIPAGVYGRKIPAGGIPIPAAIDPSASVSVYRRQQSCYRIEDCSRMLVANCNIG